MVDLKHGFRAVTEQGSPVPTSSIYGPMRKYDDDAAAACESIGPYPGFGNTYDEDGACLVYVVYKNTGAVAYDELFSMPITSSYDEFNFEPQSDGNHPRMNIGTGHTFDPGASTEALGRDEGGVRLFHYKGLLDAASDASNWGFYYTPSHDITETIPPGTWERNLVVADGTDISLGARNASGDYAVNCALGMLLIWWWDCRYPIGVADGAHRVLHYMDNIENELPNLFSVIRPEYFIPSAAAVGNAPTGTIYGPLVGPLGGPI
jgi:hypothetical protein